MSESTMMTVIISIIIIALGVIGANGYANAETFLGGLLGFVLSVGSLIAICFVVIMLRAKFGWVKRKFHWLLLIIALIPTVATIWGFFLGVSVLVLVCEACIIVSIGSIAILYIRCQTDDMENVSHFSLIILFAILLIAIKIEPTWQIITTFFSVLWTVIAVVFAIIESNKMKIVRFAIVK